MNYRINKEVKIPLNKIFLEGELTIPQKANAIVIFAHGSGSSRFSKRNQLVAKYLQEKKIGTLLFDLLTADEDLHYYNRFDIDLLTNRLAGATEWLEKLPAANDCRIGYFGASTGAASALRAASLLPKISAVVSRGGRPDLAMDCISSVIAPTLFIVGGLDYDVLKLNQKAYDLLHCDKKLEIIPGATHLFDEKGAMSKVCALAIDWFEKYLCPVTTSK